MIKKQAIGIAMFILTTTTSAIAEPICVPFKVVGGEGNSVSKQVSQPNMTKLLRSNWDTDFAVPTRQSFKRFMVTLKSESSAKAPFKVQINLKYNDKTVDNAFDSKVELDPGKSKVTTVMPRINNQPYQINVNVGGTDAIGYGYNLSVSGCE
jgi:hypothetical protein